MLRLVAALGLAHLPRALLYQTSTYDTLAFVAVPAVLCVVAGAAILLPGAGADNAWSRQWRCTTNSYLRKTDLADEYREPRV